MRKQSVFVGKVFQNSERKYYLYAMEMGLFLGVDLWSGRTWAFTARDLTSFEVITFGEYLAASDLRHREVAVEILKRLGVAVQ